MGAADAYVNSIWDQKRWIAATPPGNGVQLGDIVAFRHGVAFHVSTLSSKRIDFKPGKGETQGLWNCQSKSGVSVAAKLKGEVPKGVKLGVLGIDDVGAVVKTRSEDAFLMSLSGVRFDKIEDVSVLGGPIRKLFLRNQWDTGWLIVTEVVHAGSGTFLSTHSGGGRFELKAAAKISVAPKIDIADLSAGFKLVSSAESSEVFASKKNISPLFRCHRWKIIGGVDPTRPGRFLASEEEHELEEFDLESI